MHEVHIYTDGAAKGNPARIRGPVGREQPRRVVFLLESQRVLGRDEELISVQDAELKAAGVFGGLLR